MKLAHNWWDILVRAWSIRLMAVAGIIQGLEAILPFIDDILPFSPETRAAITFAIVVAAFASRLVAQKGISDESHPE